MDGLPPGHAFQPYRVEDDGRSIAAIADAINASCYAGFSMDTRHGCPPGRIFAAPLAEYERLVAALAADPRIDVVPHRDLLDGPVAPGRIRAVLRHDIDLDIVTALEMARIEARHGVQSTYYVLHTGPYYGRFRNGVFRRSAAAAHIYRRLQDLGHEVGLHSDPLHVYQDHGIDGAQALTAELAWLRDNGLAITGTCAHNSAGTYGACNYAVFEGRPRALLMASDGNAVMHNGKWAPLHVLSERALGLAYECNDVFWQPGTPVEYACIMGYDHWARENDKHRQHPDYKDNGRPRPKAWSATTDRFLEEIATLPGGRFLVIVVHPIYYGLRVSPHQGPVRDLTRRPADAKPMLGWRTWRPWSHVASRRMHGSTAVQAVSYANGWGMLCTRTPDDPPAGRTVWLFGGSTVDGADVSLPAQVASQTEAALKAAGAPPQGVVKLAHPGMGIAQQCGWLDGALSAARHRPDTIVLSIASDEAVRSLPDHWAVATGWNPDRPPGPYLRLADDGSAIIQPAAPDAAIRRRRPHAGGRSAPSLAKAGDAGGTDRARVMALIAAAVSRARDTGADVLLLIETCGEAQGLWDPGQPSAARSAAHAAMTGALDDLQARLPAPVAIVDPYVELLGEGSGAPSPEAWHRAAARVLATALS